MDQIGNALERIAGALERIAAAIERGAILSQDNLSAATELIEESQKLGEAASKQALSTEAVSTVERSEERSSELKARLEPGLEAPLKSELAPEVLPVSQVGLEVASEATLEPESKSEFEGQLIKYESSETEAVPLSKEEVGETEELIFELPDNRSKENFAGTYPALSQFLESRGIAICEVFSPLVPQALDDRLEEIALYMGKRYSDIAPLLLAIKANLRTGFNFSLDFASCSAASAKIIDKLCRALYEIAFLDEYRYLGYPDFKVQARASTIGIAHNFFSGFWFERYIAQETVAIIKAVRNEFNLEADNFEIIRNAKLMCQGIPRERDLLISCADQYYWLECKSGDNYIDSIPAYDTFSAHFDFERDNCFLVFLSAEAGYHRAAGSGMQICSSAEFPERFANLLRANLEKAGYTRGA